ncbi:aryl-sulfate sulfotransferase [uncultured Algibacter sp.]|uniref:aryl-sulfate sulfotransferase n=1 Tax=uncultured Algibacter sp. TaxID=298659 RepID=UPI00262331FA|nr:aryl-sulfate sulfotransferase [uncultured Algibacter sp.]
MRIIIYFILLLSYSLTLHAQNTVGVIKNNSEAFNGYTLFSPNTSNETYLINNCGEIVHQWTSVYNPGVSVYLLENGNLLRAAKIPNDNVVFGGVGGKVELFDWDNNLVWDYTYSTNEVSQHHEVLPLPNGNILILAAKILTEVQAIQAGRDPNLITEGKIYSEKIIEIQPDLINGGGTIVWEWDIKDHLIQDLDASKDNFGNVANNPQLLDINFINENSNGGAANWLHFNSVQYNIDLDQLILSSRLLSEIYIIDHSTTSKEAASHTGGNYGKGGDFLYRWGNPQSYRLGNNSDKKLFGQHFPHWIPENLNDAGKIMIFNNGNSREIDKNNLPINYSSIDIIDPNVDINGNYNFNLVNGFEPQNLTWTYIDPVERKKFFSPILSGAQRLPNGNTLICSGSLGYFFEINSNKEIVWEYINPDTSNGILSQGSLASANSVFRANKYDVNDPVFEGKSLIPKRPIEMNSQINESCTLLEVNNYTNYNFKMYPNPVNNTLHINSKNKIINIEVYNILGLLIKNKKDENGIDSIDLSNLNKSIYIIKAYSNNLIISEKIIKN